MFVETVVEYDMEQCRTDLAVFRMVVDGKEEQIVTLHVDDIVMARSDETCMHGLPYRVNCEIHHESPRRTGLVHWLCFQAQLGIGHVRYYAEGFRGKHAESFGCELVF